MKHQIIKKLTAIVMALCLVLGSTVVYCASEEQATEDRNTLSQLLYTYTYSENGKKLKSTLKEEYVDYFAGTYINDDRCLVVLFTEQTPEETVAYLTADLSDEVQIRYVKYSYTELTAAVDKHSDTLAELTKKVANGTATDEETALSENIVGLGLSVENNCTEFCLKSITDETKAAVIEYFGDDNVIFEQGSSITTDLKEVVSTIKINKSKATVVKNETLKLKVLKGVSKVKNSKIKWSTSKKKVAKVNNNGKVTALKKGTAKITAKYKGVKYTCKVKVENPKLPAILLKINKTRKLKVENTTLSVKKWKSKDTSIATVSAKGVIKAHACGTTTIIAKVSNTKLKCKVTVFKKLPPDNATVDD